MKVKFAAIALLTGALIAAPLAPAQAQGWHHGGGYYHGGHGHDGGLLFGIGAAVGAVAGAAVTLAAAPFNAIAEAGTPAPVYAQPVYAAAAPYYAQPVYYQPRPVPVYRYAQPAYPVYYGYAQ